MKMRDTRMKDKQRLNSIFLEMGMDKDVASIISGINKKNNDRRKENEKKSVDNNKRR